MLFFVVLFRWLAPFKFVFIGVCDSLRYSMIILSYNFWGLGNRRTFCDLKNLVGDKHSNVIFLAETRMSVVQMRGLVRRLGLGDVLSAPRDDLSGGLCLLWLSRLHVTLLSSSVGHIDVRIISPNKFVTRVTGVYGHPDPNQCIHSSRLLRRLSQVNFGMWLCCGDFNEILTTNERLALEFDWVLVLRTFSKWCEIFIYSHLILWDIPVHGGTIERVMPMCRACLDRGFGNLQLIHQ